jgi:hypothetical protein
MLSAWEAEVGIDTCKNFQILNFKKMYDREVNAYYLTILRRGSVMVRRGSVGSASACCKAGPSLVLGSAPQGGVSH